MEKKIQARSWELLYTFIEEKYDIEKMSNSIRMCNSDALCVKLLGTKEYRVESDETSFRGMWRFVDYRTQEEGAKHFRQPDILVASRSGQKSEIKRQPDVAVAI